jgi:hypothetical protein
LLAERFPKRLAELGFEPRKVGDVEVIVPPLRAVPAGAFLMGSDPQRDNEASNDEKPQHQVNVGAFLIWRALIAAYHTGAVPVERLTAGARGWAAHAAHGDTFGLRRALLRRPIPPPLNLAHAQVG